MKHSQIKALRRMRLDPAALHPEAVKAFFALTDKGEGDGWDKVFSDLGPARRKCGVIYGPPSSAIQEDFLKLEGAFHWVSIEEKDWKADFKGIQIKPGGAHWPLLWPQDFDGEPREVRSAAMNAYKAVFDWLPSVWCPFLREVRQHLEPTWGVKHEL